MVVEALLVIYLFRLGSELILIDIRNLVGRVPVSYDMAGPYQLRCTSCESPPKRGLYALL